MTSKLLKVCSATGDEQRVFLGIKPRAGAGISGSAADSDGELPHDRGQLAGCVNAPNSSSVKRGQQPPTSHCAAQLINAPLSCED